MRTSPAPSSTQLLQYRNVKEVSGVVVFFAQVDHQFEASTNDAFLK